MHERDSATDTEAQDTDCYRAGSTSDEEVAAAYHGAAGRTIVGPDPRHPEDALERVGRTRLGTAVVDLRCRRCGETVDRDIRGRLDGQLATDGGSGEWTGRARALADRDDWRGDYLEGDDGGDE